MIRLVRASALPDRDSMACRVLDSCITLVLLLHSSPPVQCVAVRSWRSTVHICSPRRWKPFCRWPLDLSVDLGGAWSLAIVTEAGSICSSQSGQLDAAARYLRRPAKCPFCVLGSPNTSSSFPLLLPCPYSKLPGTDILDRSLRSGSKFPPFLLPSPPST